MEGSTASSQPWFIVSPFRPIEFSTHLAWSTWYASIYLVAWKNNNFQLSVFHPASYTCTVDRSLSGILAKFADCACKSHNLEIACVCYIISRLAVQSRDWNAISEFWECATQSRDCTNSQIARNMYIHKKVVTGWGPSPSIYLLHDLSGMYESKVCSELTATSAIR